MYTPLCPTPTSAADREYSAVMDVLKHLSLPPGRLQELEYHWQSYTPEAFSLLRHLLLELRHGAQPRYIFTWHWSSQQRDYAGVTREARHFKNVMLKRVWGYNRIQQPNVALAPAMYFSHERSTESNRFQTHLLIPQPPAKHDNVLALSSEFNGHFRRAIRALDRDRTIDVRLITEPVGVMSYIVKQASSSYTPLDFELSVFIQQGCQGPRLRRGGEPLFSPLAMQWKVHGGEAVADTKVRGGQSACQQRWLGGTNQPGKVPVEVMSCKVTQHPGRQDSP